MSGLRWKLFLSHLLICFIPLIFFANTISISMESYFSAERSRELTKYGNYVAGQITELQALTQPNTYLKVKNDLQAHSRDWGISRALIINESSFVVIDSSNVLESTIFSSADVKSALSGKSKYSLSEDKTKMYAAVPIAGEGEQTGAIGAVLISSNIDEINYMLRQITQKLFLSATLLALIVSVLVFFVSQLLIDPLKEIRDVVSKMSAGHFGQRINISGHDEFAAVGAAFNDMSGELERVEKTRQEFVSNVSHELKTPLSSMKVLSESLLLQSDAPVMMYREFLTDITNEIDRMTDIINELLTLVKLDRSETPLNIKRINVAKVLEDVVKRLNPIAGKTDVTLTMEETPPLFADADEMKLSLAFTNLIENAIKYNYDGGFVKVSSEADRQNIFVTIEDNGVGIPEAEQTKIFSRFYRVDKTRQRETGGTGLGLSITHKIVLLHEGSIKIISKENEGSTFIVRLPIERDKEK
ncbi:two-component sensor histidine kinase [Clostridia bacterium]|nr:two-component sensor histidine kinase [Clostridia bacterium]